MYCVYMHTVPNGKVYIGITSQKPSRRWRDGEGYKTNNAFYFAIQKYGWENIKHEILYSDLSKEEACEKEMELIKKMMSHDRNHGYNFTFGGECYEFTDEIKKKMKTNHSHSWKGKQHSEETKKKISVSNKGKVFSEEHKTKIKQNHHHIKTFEGKHHSEESKRKISENHFRYYGAMNPASKKVRCVETGEIFDTIKEAAEKKHANKNHISSCCCGKRKRSGGFHWEYVSQAS